MKIIKSSTANVMLGFASLLIVFAPPLFSGETYDYDAQGRLTKVTYGDSMSIAYTYDSNSNILAIDVDSPVTAVVAERQPDLLPKVFALEQNYPNPFNPETIIRYALPKAAPVRIAIYNLLGQQVKKLVDKEQLPGFHQVHWDGTNDAGLKLASGLYVYRMEAGQFVKIRKMMMLK